MTAPKPRPRRRDVTERTDEILRRCYPGEADHLVLERAAILLATADGHLDATGTPVPERYRRQT